MKGKNLLRRIGCAMLCVYLLSTTALAKELVPVGRIVGLELRSAQVVVAGFDEKQGAAAKSAGLQGGGRGRRSI